MFASLSEGGENDAMFNGLLGMIVAFFGFTIGVVQHAVAHVVKAAVKEEIKPLETSINDLATQANVDRRAEDFSFRARSLDCNSHWDAIVTDYRNLQHLKLEDLKPNVIDRNSHLVLARISPTVRKVIYGQIIDANSHRVPLPSSKYEELREIESEIKDESCSGNFWYKVGICYLPTKEGFADAKRAFEHGRLMITPNNPVQVADTKCIAMYILCELCDDNNNPTATEKKDAAMRSLDRTMSLIKSMGNGEIKSIIESLNSWHRDDFTEKVIFNGKSSERRLAYQELLKALKAKVPESLIE